MILEHGYSFQQECSLRVVSTGLWGEGCVGQDGLLVPRRSTCDSCMSLSSIACEFCALYC